MDYELLDCGGGRKLERFATVRVARPALGATGRVRDGAAWADVDLEYSRGDPSGEWITHRELPDPWIVESSGVRFELFVAPSGQVGLFPEQVSVRERLAGWVRAHPGAKVLDLFAFTGGTSVVAAAAGAEVTYVDGAHSMVARLRRNLALNGLDGAPVRSIVEDARRFVAREVRRGSRYDVVVLDPPTFGRGPGGAAFHIERDLDALLADVRRLLTDGPALVVLSAHTESWTAARLARRLDAALTDRSGRTGCGDLTLAAASGASLAAGICAWRELGAVEAGHDPDGALRREQT